MRLVAGPLFFDLSLRGAQQRSNLAFRSGKKTRLLRRCASFHEPDLTDACINDGLPLTPTPLPKGARGSIPLSRFAGEGWGGVA